MSRSLHDCHEPSWMGIALALRAISQRAEPIPIVRLTIRKMLSRMKNPRRMEFAKPLPFAGAQPLHRGRLAGIRVGKHEDAAVPALFPDRLVIFAAKQAEHVAKYIDDGIGRIPRPYDRNLVIGHRRS